MVRGAQVSLAPAISPCSSRSRRAERSFSRHTSFRREPSAGSAWTIARMMVERDLRRPLRCLACAMLCRTLRRVANAEVARCVCSRLFVSRLFKSIRRVHELGRSGVSNVRDLAAARVSGPRRRWQLCARSAAVLASAQTSLLERVSRARPAAKMRLGQVGSFHAVASPFFSSTVPRRAWSRRTRVPRCPASVRCPSCAERGPCGPQLDLSRGTGGIVELGVPHSSDGTLDCLSGVISTSWPLRRLEQIARAALGIDDPARRTSVSSTVSAVDQLESRVASGAPPLGTEGPAGPLSVWRHTSSGDAWHHPIEGSRPSRSGDTNSTLLRGCRMYSAANCARFCRASVHRCATLPSQPPATADAAPRRSQRDTNSRACSHVHEPASDSSPTTSWARRSSQPLLPATIQPNTSIRSLAAIVLRGSWTRPRPDGTVPRPSLFGPLRRYDATPLPLAAAGAM